MHTWIFLSGAEPPKGAVFCHLITGTVTYAVDYSLVVDVAMDGLPTRLSRALFAAVSGTTWVRPLSESAVVVFFA